MQGLNQRQELFCQGVSAGLSPTDSYIKAGFKIKNRISAKNAAQRLKKRPQIKARLQELAKKVESKAIMTIAEAQERLSSYARREPQQDGEDVTFPSIQESIKATELLIRAQGGFVERRQVEMQGAVPIVIKDDVNE